MVAWGYLCVVTFVNSDLDRIAGGEGFRGMCSQRHRVEGVTSVGLTVRASFFAIIHIVYDTWYSVSWKAQVNHGAGMEGRM